MKKFFLMLCVATVAFSALAQTADNTQNATEKSINKRHGNGKDMHEHMKTLNLTEAQQRQVKDLSASLRVQMEELKKTSSLSFDEKKARRKALQKQYRSDVEKLLTDEQRTRWNELRKANAKKGNGKGRSYNKSERAEQVEKDI